MLEGKVESARASGRSVQKWTENIKKWSGYSIME
jgi:hypothetical protein